MNGRTIALILFVWALLTVITPTLVRMSASAKLLDGIHARGMESRLLPRRALMDTKFIESPESEPELAPEPAPGVVWRSRLGLCSVCDCPDSIGCRGRCVCCAQ